jgi:hypothetical protein
VPAEDNMSELKKHIQTLKSKVKPKKITIETKKKKEQYSLDTVEEQLEAFDTTTHSKDAETDMKKVKKNPEQYLEINMVKKSRVVDTFFIKAENKTFDYKNKNYTIDEDVVYLLPMKGYFVPTCYYKEGTGKPVGFKQRNKGITGKALTLLYKTRLYETLFKVEDNSLNIFIVFLTLILLILYAIGMYFLFFHNGGQVSGGAEPLNPFVQTIIGGW